MPFAFSAGQPRGWASSCRAQARGGRRSAASIAVDGRAALPSGGWVAAGCRLSSSNVPGWVVSQPWWVVSMVVAFRRRFESPRAYRPAPRKRGACAADETAALPRRQRWTLDTPHRRAHVASLSRPLVLALLPIFRSAPHRGAHTEKSNLVRPPAAHRGRKRRGGRAAGLDGRPCPNPPALSPWGKGARGHGSAAAGTGAALIALPAGCSVRGPP